MRKVIVSIIALLLIITIGFPGLTTFADTLVDNNLEKESAVNLEEITQVIDEMKDSGLLKENEFGTLQITDQYIQEVQSNLGDAYTVTATNNTLKVVENRPMYRGLLGGGETKVVFNDTSIDIFINGTLCTLLKGGMDITAFITSLIPVPVLNTVVEKMINLSSKVILGKNKGNGVIVSIKIFKGSYIPYFVTIKAQN